MTTTATVQPTAYFVWAERTPRGFMAYCDCGRTTISAFSETELVLAIRQHCEVEHPGQRCSWKMVSR